MSLAAAQQRRGRAGRVQPGACFKLFSRKQAAQMQVCALCLHKLHCSLVTGNKTLGSLLIELVLSWERYSFLQRLSWCSFMRLTAAATATPYWALVCVCSQAQ